VIIILKPTLPPDSHWEVQFSNPEKGSKSEENDPLTLLEVWLQASLSK